MFLMVLLMTEGNLILLKYVWSHLENQKSLFQLNWCLRKTKKTHFHFDSLTDHQCGNESCCLQSVCEVE